MTAAMPKESFVDIPIAPLSPAFEVGLAHVGFHAWGDGA
jgi:hypothetical protein